MRSTSLQPKNNKKREIEIEVTLEWRFLFTRSQELQCSRSSSMIFLWSFKQNWTVESSWIYFNFQNPLPCSCSCTARFLDELHQIVDESCSVKHEDQYYARIFELYVKKMRIRSERKFERILEFFDLKSSVIPVMIRVWPFILHANDHANPLFHVLIMISEYWSKLQKCTLS